MPFRHFHPIFKNDIGRGVVGLFHEPGYSRELEAYLRLCS
jgi:hypothetical protein